MSSSRLIAQNLTFLGLLTVFLVLATLYSAIIPLGEGPDEPGHADYAFFLARAGRLPVQRLDSQQSDVPGEGHQPPLAYALMAPLALSLPRDGRQTDTIGNPRFVWSGGAESNAISHGSREYLPWQGSVLAWHLMRLVSAVCGAATVFFTYLAAREIDFRLAASQPRVTSSKSKIPLLAAGLVALNPQFLFVAALVTNDTLLSALSAALLWLVVKDEKRKHQAGQAVQRSDTYLLKRAIVLGVVLALALLTKQSAVILVPVAVLAVMSRVAPGQERPAQAAAEVPSASRQWRAPSRPQFRLLSGLLVIGAVVLVAGWWYARNQRLYGDLLGLAAFRGEFATQPFQIGSPAAWITALGQLHASFWARFGWMNVVPPAWVLWVIGAIELLALAGLVRLAVQVWRAGRWSVVDGLSSVVGHWVLLAIPVLALAWMVSFALTAGLVAWQGRLLFPALPAIAILMARGLAAWGEPRAEDGELKIEDRRSRLSSRQHPALSFILYHQLSRNALVVGIVLCPLLLLAAWIPENVIRPAYSPQTLPEPVALAQAGNSVVFRFRRRGERSITLRGWRLDSPARPGASLDLTLTWFASARQMRDWVVYLQLIDQQGRAVAEAHGAPRDGMFPTTQWNLGDWIADRHQIQLPADLASGTYTLRIWLQDSRDNRRADVRIDEARPLGDTLDLGSIIVGGK